MINFLFPWLNAIVYGEKINGKRVQHGGTKDAPFDRHDFKVGIFGWGAYTPKATYHLIPTITVKDQGQYNTCGWNSVTVQKECDEKIPLSVSGLVRYARRQGLISGQGESNLRDDQQAIHDFGVPDASLFNESDPNWSSYSDPAGLTAPVVANAASHKDQSYWSVSARSDILKLLDQDRTIATGLDWYSGYNMSQGFAAPFVINGKPGVLVGGHAFIMKGYIFEYKGIDSSGSILTGPGGQDVYVFQNSYGASWGATATDEKGLIHKGLFFIAMNYFETYGYTRYTTLDVPVDQATFLREYNTMNVKVEGSSAIYWVANGKRYPYPDMLTYLGYNGRRGDYQTLYLSNPSLVATFNTVLEGPAMVLAEAPLFPLMQASINPVNMDAILQAVHQAGVDSHFDITLNQWVATGLPGSNMVSYANH